MLDKHAAVATGGVETVAELVALDAILLADFPTLDELNTVTS
jgi:hypothetical protein